MKKITDRFMLIVSTRSQKICMYSCGIIVILIQNLSKKKKSFNLSCNDHVTLTVNNIVLLKKFKI